MKMKVEREFVNHVAELGRISIKEEEIEDFSTQLGQVLKWAEKLNELDLRGVEPSAHVFDIKNVFRQDDRRESLSTEKALENAPDKDGGYFRVPRIIEE